MPKSSALKKNNPSELEESEKLEESENEVASNNLQIGDYTTTTLNKLTSKITNDYKSTSSQEIESTSFFRKKNYYLTIDSDYHINIIKSCLIGSDSDIAEFVIKDLHNSPKICKFYLENDLLYILNLQFKTVIKINSTVLNPGKLYILKYKESIFIEYHKLEINPEIPLILEDPEEIAKRRKQWEEEFNRSLGRDNDNNPQKKEDDKKESKDTLPLDEKIKIFFSQLSNDISTLFQALINEIFFRTFLYNNKLELQLASIERRLLAFSLDIGLAITLHSLLIILNINEYHTFNNLFNDNLSSNINLLLIQIDKTNTPLIMTAIKNYLALTPLMIYFSQQLLFTFLLGNSLFGSILGITGHAGFIYNRIMGLFRTTIGLLTFPFIIFDLPLLFAYPSFKEIISRSLLVKKIKVVKEQLAETETKTETKIKRKTVSKTATVDDQNEDKRQNEKIDIDEEIKQILTIPNRLQLFQEFIKEKLNKNVVTAKILFIYQKTSNLISFLLLTNTYNRKDGYIFPTIERRICALILDLTIPTIIYKLFIERKQFAIDIIINIDNLIPIEIIKQIGKLNSLASLYIYNFYSNITFYINQILNSSFSLEQYHFHLFTQIPPMPVILFYLTFNLILGVSLFQFIFGIRSSIKSFFFKRIMGVIRSSIGLILLPYMIFELPLIFKIPSFKEILSRNALVNNKLIIPLGST
ncbi:MAG: hypothetical protein HQK49_21040 [Oligoflexia bacterium]|nr:hypothetical protein [Oligoflexia bacterium]